MEDMFTAYMKTICNVICQAMEDNNYEILRGLQSFDLSPWMGLRGIELMVTVIVDLSIASNPFRFGLDENSDELGLYDKIRKRFHLEKEGKISYGVLRYALGGLSDKITRLNKLAQKGLIEIGPTTSITSDQSLISLTKLWNPFLETVIRDEVEMKFFISSLGKMVALGVEEKGIRFFKPIIRALNSAENNNSEISMDDFLNYYIETGLPYYYFPISIRTDEKKSESIRLIAFKDNKRILFNEHSIKALQVWRTAARNYLLERTI